MSVVYTRSDSVGRSIIPSPLVSINKNYQSNDDGTKIGTIYSITLTGTMLSFMGSPSGSYSSLNQAFHTLGGYPPDDTDTGNNENFNNIIRKQEALRWLFSEDGGTLEWQPSDGQPPVRCYPKILSINFPEGQWANKCEYTIEMEAPWIYINGQLNVEDDISMDSISSSTETWSFEEVDGHENTQYRVTHEVNANGKLSYAGASGLYENKQAWEHAKTFVDSRIDGLVDNDVMFAALGASGKITGNYNTITNIDQDGGTYGVTEEWLLSDGNTYEERKFTVDYDQTNGEYNITYEGVIYGVATGSRAGNVGGLNQAKAAVPSASAARLTAISYLGSLIGSKSIPTHPDRHTVNLDQQNSTVTFTYTWETSDSSTVFITEESQHSYSVSDLLNTLTYTQTAEGKGDSVSERLTNAKNAIYGDGAALSNAKTLASTYLSYTKLSTAASFDKRSGTAKKTWTWTDRDAHQTEVTIQTQEANAVLAIIPIPGRAAGPIIQDMSTQSSETITVTMRSKGNITRPTLNTVIYSEGGLITSDSTTWNPETGVAERTTRFLKDS